MKINWQPILKNDFIRLQPIQADDFEKLYLVASDPFIWEQHPNKNRYKREVFQTFFEGALASGGAFLIYDNAKNEVVGSTRFYDYEEAAKTVLIGYTFYAKAAWGKGYNLAVKKIMLEYAFQFVDKVIFHVGAENFRSQKAMAKLPSSKIDEIIVSYYGEADKLNFVYEINKEDFFKLNPSNIDVKISS